MTGEVRRKSSFAAEGSLRERALEIANKVPRHAISAVLKEVDSAAANPERADVLRSILIEHFNRLRPMKARRLFTSLFEPLLTDDRVLFRAPDTVPGLFQRVDVGGIWAALTHGPLRSIAIDVQQKLDAAARTDLLDRVLEAPEAQAMRGAMAREAAVHIESLRDQRKALDAFLAHANREALNHARVNEPDLAGKAPIDTEMLSLFVAILHDGDRLRPTLRDLRTTLAGSAIGYTLNTGLAKSAVMESYRTISSGLPARADDDPIRWLPMLLAINVHRRFDVAGRIIRDEGTLISSDSPHVPRAIFNHFAAACATINGLLGTLFTRELVLGEAPLQLPPPARALLRDAMDRFAAALPVLVNGGLLGSHNIAVRFQPLLTEISHTMRTYVIPAAARRARFALEAQDRAAVDHDDVVWTLTLLNDWKKALSAAEYVTHDMEPLYRTVLRDAEDAHNQALKLGPGDDPQHNMAYLLRIDAVLNALDASFSAWANPMSRGLQTILRVYLEPNRPHPPEVERILAAYVAAIRRELSRSKRWQSADLTDLVALYHRHAEPECG